MFDRIANSWELVKASAAVLRADKELIVFPIVSGLASLLVTITFAVPMILTNGFDAIAAEGGQVLGIIVGFLFYLVQYFVIFFANSALVGAALIRLQGGNPTVGDGFRIAMQHSRAIFGYALIAATVGMILRWLSERAGIIGRIVVSLIGFAWNVATFLVVPVLVNEQIGPVDAIKRSGQLLKKTWGEQIIGNLGIGAVFGLITFGVILLSIPLIVLAALSQSVALLIAAVVLAVLLLIGVGLINATLSGIYTAAVYRYVTTGQVSAQFRPELIQAAFRRK